MTLSIDKDHPLNVAAWGGMVDWGWRTEEIRQQFEEATGLHYVALAQGGFAALIDQACGVEQGNDEYFRRFVLWISENYWGDADETPSVIEKFKQEAKDA